jgi:DivIVA domain-containing protein
VANESSPARGKRRRERSPGLQGRVEGFSDLRQYVPAEILDVSFPVGVRGYERRAVDEYVKRVNRAIAELKVSASPPAAVRHALEQAGEKVEGLLRAAREAGEEITASARQEAEAGTARARAEAAELLVDSSAEAERVKAEADELLANARAEAEEAVARAKAEADTIVSDARAEAQQVIERTQAESSERFRKLEQELAALRDQAEARLRGLKADSDAIWLQRGDLLDNIESIGGALLDLAKTAGERLPPQPSSEIVNDARSETEPTTMATEQTARLIPAVGVPPGTSESDGERAQQTTAGPDS